MTVNRNDPCPCGSGKKYKKCCLRTAEVISLERVRADRAHEALLERLVRRLGDRKLEQEINVALFRFFGGSPPEDPSEEEMDLPMDWILFGYEFPSLGSTLCEHFAAHEKGLSSFESEVVAGWTHAQPGFFHVTEVTEREVHLRRLWGVRPYTVTASGTGLKTGDLVAAWLLPVSTGFRFGFSLLPLPVEITRPLEHLVREELSTLRRQRPDATFDDLYRLCWPRLLDDAVLAAVKGEELLNVRVVNGPYVQGSPSSDPKWTAVADRFVEEMQWREALPGEVEGALRLWWDVVHVLRPRVTRVETWVGGLLYVLCNRVYGMDMTQGEVAEEVGVSAGTVGARAREIEAALKVERCDPRYVDLLHPLIRTDWHLDCLMMAETGSRILAPLPEQELRGAEPFLEEEADHEGGPVARAEALVDEAWEATGKRRIQLAKQALQLWPDAADAYVILGNEAKERGEIEEARRYYQEGVQAGERALGSEFFTQNIGDFWLLIETRPYMRARHGLAECLWLLGEKEAAIDHYQEMLRLNPNDNQGVRYLLASRFLELGDDDRLGKLLAQYADDGMAAILYTRALWGFRQKGPGREADALLREAIHQNPHVPAYLLNERPVPPEPPEYIGWGDETEAAAYALEFGAGWRGTEGALRWLASRTGR